MNNPTQLLLTLAFSLALFYQAQAQEKVLVLDRYTTKRIKLAEGTPITIKLKGEDRFKIKDVIKELRDSTLVLANRNHEIHLNEIACFYFDRKLVRSLSPKLSYMGGGFLLSAAVSPLMGETFYNAGESAVIGGAFIGLAQLLRLADKKKYKITNNTRIRILDLSFQNLAPTAIDQSRK